MLLQPVEKMLSATLCDLILNEAQFHDSVLFFLNGVQDSVQAYVSYFISVELDRLYD